MNEKPGSSTLFDGPIKVRENTINGEVIDKLRLVGQRKVDLEQYCYAISEQHTFLISKKDLNTLVEADPDLWETLVQIQGSTINDEPIIELTKTDLEADWDLDIYAWAKTANHSYALTKTQYTRILQEFEKK